MATTRTANTIGKAICWRERAPFSLSSSNIGTYDVSWPARSEEPGGKTSPEELIAAAHFSRYSMAFAHGLAGKGYTVASLDTKADITFQPGEGITTITLTVHASVPGLSEEEFQTAAQDAKQNCPVSKALSGVPEITLDAVPYERQLSPPYFPAQVSW